MNNIRELDPQNRMSLSKILLNMCNISTKSKVAICRLSENQIMIRELSNIKDCEVIGVTRIDDKGRIVIPRKIRGNTKAFNIFAKNGNLIVEEAH